MALNLGYISYTINFIYFILNFTHLQNYLLVERLWENCLNHNHILFLSFQEVFQQLSHKDTSLSQPTLSQQKNNHQNINTIKESEVEEEDNKNG